MEEKHKDRRQRWVGCPIEEHYLGDDRKQGKMMRKRAIAKDRSKYKKTDRDKMLKTEKPESSHLLRGRVISITSQGIVVDSDGRTIVCSLKGSLKKEKTQYKNLITVGDFVLFEPAAAEEGAIAFVEPRHSVLSRADNLSQKKEQLIASNIDQVLITISVVEPALKPPLVDRYIIATYRGNMEPVIVLNKVDLLDHENPFVQQERALYEEMLTAYKIAGIPVVCVSASSGSGLDQLKTIMQGKASVFSGQSGVGKSSLINAVTGLNLETRHIVDRTNKGAHTTTRAHLLPLPFGGWCVDTPGIKSFGLWDLKSIDIEPYYHEIHQCGLDCKFPNCTHTHEADCAVKKAVEKGKISSLRYETYCDLIQSTKEGHIKR